jgi:hypothetical protein
VGLCKVQYVLRIWSPCPHRNRVPAVAGSASATPELGGGSLSAIVIAVDHEHSDQLLEELCRLGPEGERAVEMFTAAAEQIDRAGTRAGNQIAYCTREALMSLLDLGGKPQRLVSDAADRVVQVADEVRGERASRESLLEAIEQLAAARKGPGPHTIRLEKLITALARRPPVRATADLIATYDELLAEVNALHADVTLDAAIRLHSRARTTVARLFGPISARLEEIDPLARITEPTPEDVTRLVSLSGEPRTLSYFFSRLDGPGWLLALAGHTLLQPPKEGPWFSYGYVMKLVDSHPDRVRAWLSSRPSGRELSDHQAYMLITVARTVGGPVAEAVLRISTGRTADTGVLHQITGYLETLPAKEHTGDGVIRLVKRALGAAAGEHAAKEDIYLCASLLQVALSGARQGQARRWFGILTAKLHAASEQSSTELRRLQPIGGLTLHPDAPVLDQLAAAVRDVARLAASEGMPTEARVQRLSSLPAALAGRITAAHIMETVVADATEALALITDQVAHHDAMPETLRLLDELTQREMPGLDQRMLDALGDPPGASELASFAHGADFPRAWTHAFGWLIAMPASVKHAWSEANAKVEERWGAASRNGYLWPEPTVMRVPPRAAVGKEELAGLEPLDAARRIAGWKPTGGFADATRYDASRELQELITSDPERWLAQPPAPILDALGDPAYAERYLNTLAEHAQELHQKPSAILDAAELAERNMSTHQASGEPDGETWANVLATAIELIGKLADADTSFGAETDRGWDLIERAVRRRGDTASHPLGEGRPLEQAIYRRPMQALSAAFVYAHASTHGEQEPKRLLSLLDEVLALEAPDGLHARAIIGRNLPWLAWRAPTWTSSRWTRLVGADAPGGLGPRTFDLYLEWGAPTAELLTAHPDLYLAAVERVPDHARRHLLHAMIWGLDGYDPARVLETLSGAGDGQVQEAIRWLSFGAFHETDMPLEPAIEFLRLALELRLPAGTYESLGWLSRVERIDSDIWLELTLSGVQAADGQLEPAQDVAERAAKHPGEDRANRIVAGLLDADVKLWHLEDIGRAGLELLDAGERSTPAAREELREQLLKREFFDARLPPP